MDTFVHSLLSSPARPVASASATHAVRGGTTSRGAEGGFGELVSTLVDEASPGGNAAAGTTASAKSADESRGSDDPRSAGESSADRQDRGAGLDLLVPAQQPPVLEGSPGAPAVVPVGNALELGASSVPLDPRFQVHEGGLALDTDLGMMTATEEPSSAEVPWSDGARSVASPRASTLHAAVAQHTVSGSARALPVGGPPVSTTEASASTGGTGAMRRASAPIHADHLGGSGADDGIGVAGSSSAAAMLDTIGQDLAAGDASSVVRTSADVADLTVERYYADSPALLADAVVESRPNAEATPRDDSGPFIGPRAESSGGAAVFTQPLVSPPSSTEAGGPAPGHLGKSGATSDSTSEGPLEYLASIGGAPSTESDAKLGTLMSGATGAAAMSAEAAGIASEWAAPGLRRGSGSVAGDIAGNPDGASPMSPPTHDSPAMALAGSAQEGAGDTADSRPRKHGLGKGERPAESALATSVSAGAVNLEEHDEVRGAPQAFANVATVEIRAVPNPEGTGPQEIRFEPLAATTWPSGGAMPRESDQGVNVGSAQRFTSLLAHAMPDEGEHVTKQVMRSLYVQWRDGVGEARVQLHPEHLGHVTLSLRVEQGAVTAAVVAETEAAQRWIEGHRDALQESLGDQGLKLSRLVVTTGRDGRRDADPEPREQRQRRPAPRRSSTSVFEVRV